LALSFFYILSVFDEGYSRNASRALNLISIFSLFNATVYIQGQDGKA